MSIFKLILCIHKENSKLSSIVANQYGISLIDSLTDYFADSQFIQKGVIVMTKEKYNAVKVKELVANPEIQTAIKKQ